MAYIQPINSLKKINLKYRYDFSGKNMIINGGPNADKATEIVIQKAEDFSAGWDKNILIYQNGFIIYTEMEHEDSGALKSSIVYTNLKLQSISNTESMYEPLFPEKN
ncbi:hypothetical protein [Companilactobacillus muriivasis]|uniref:hypothetical protein n=1 Tax=Companilactobacillus muriivasis TaxID=3081444 RepID=UPI0030C6ED00